MLRKPLTGELTPLTSDLWLTRSPGVLNRRISQMATLITTRHTSPSAPGHQAPPEFFIAQSRRVR